MREIPQPSTGQSWGWCICLVRGVMVKSTYTAGDCLCDLGEKSGQSLLAIRLGGRVVSLTYLLPLAQARGESSLWQEGHGMICPFGEV